MAASQILDAAQILKIRPQIYYFDKTIFYPIYYRH